MDGLKCSEILLAETFTATNYFRLEAEYYNSASISCQNDLKGRDIVAAIQYGTSKFCDEIKEGYPVLRLNELRNGFIELPQKHCHIMPKEEFEMLRLKRGDVLIVRTNGNPNLVGRAAVVLEDTDFAFASYLYRVITNDQINPETLVAYLNCTYGRYEIDKNSIKGNQTNFSPAKFLDINIPNLSKQLQKEIKYSFYKAYQDQSKADSIFFYAGQLLLSALGIKNSKPYEQSVSVKSFLESFVESGRLDAEYYQSQYEDYQNLLQTSETVHSLCNLHDKVFLPKDNRSYKYIELSNVGMTGNITDVETIIGSELPSRARRKVKAGQVIISSVEGSLQSCALITNEYNNALCSTGFYVLDSDAINSETLLVLFKSEPIQALLKQRCSGTILTAITKEEMLRLPLPHIDSAVQKEIASKIQESFSLRHRSEQLLDNTKKVVEIAIKHGEEEAMALFKDKEM